MGLSSRASQCDDLCSDTFTPHKLVRLHGSRELKIDFSVYLYGDGGAMNEVCVRLSFPFVSAHVHKQYMLITWCISSVCGAIEKYAAHQR